jgi:hypothetical protein
MERELDVGGPARELLEAKVCAVDERARADVAARADVRGSKVVVARPTKSLLRFKSGTMAKFFSPSITPLSTAVMSVNLSA